MAVYGDKPEEKPWLEYMRETLDWLRMYRHFHEACTELRPLPIKLGGIFLVVPVRFFVRRAYTMIGYGEGPGFVPFDLVTQVRVPDRSAGEPTTISQTHTYAAPLVNLLDEDSVLQACHRQLRDLMDHEIFEGLQRSDGRLWRDPHASDFASATQHLFDGE